MTTLALQKVDHSALKVNQIIIILFNLVAFIFNLPILTAILAVCLGIGSLLRVPTFGFVYKNALKPWGWVQPDVLDDNPEPHRFAQAVGFLFETGAASALYLGAPVLGWILVWIMVALPALNAFGVFCVGCAMYYWLARIRVPGFGKQPPSGIFPGMKPRTGEKI